MMIRITRFTDWAAPRWPLESICPIAVLIVWIILHTGCGSWPQPTRSAHSGQPGPVGSCADFFASLDRLVAASDAVDAGFHRVADYPYLRTDRFLASWGNDAEGSKSFETWIDHLQALDQSARRFEIANMSDAAVAALTPINGRKGLLRKVAVCGDLLKNADFIDGGPIQRLRQDVMVQDEYIHLRRAMGLYPLTRILVSQGVNRWHAHARDSFSFDSNTNWQSVIYAPSVKSDPAAARRIIRQTKRDALGIPTYDKSDRKLLFDAHAPHWEVETKGKFDRVGSPFWKNDGHISIDTNTPLTYTHLSFTRFGKAVLTQLNYVIWFPARPKTGMVDIYGGLLDGLNYRVTLGMDGEPILYESIHNCGCYYKAFATGRLRPRESIAYAEPPLIFKVPDLSESAPSMVVAMQSGTHYVTHLYPLPRESRSDGRTYRLVDYVELKSLAFTDGQRRSMFDRYGIVPGTQRLERYILWPTGVLSPGAMRQWGRHAVAFVGRRHFDDPFYLDALFYPTE